MYEVTMPKLSDSMQVGKIIAWHVAEGDTVATGDVLAEVESDKAAMELECFVDGTVAKIIHGADEETPVGHVIAVIAEESDEPAEAAAAAEPAREEKPAPPPPAEEKAEPKPETPAAEPPPTPKPAPAPAPAAQGRFAVSPYAKKLAEEKGVDLSAIQGSGPGGRIVAADVEAAAAGKAPTAPAPAPAPAAAAAGEAAAEPLARTLAAKLDIPLAALTGTGLGGRVTVDDVLKELQRQEEEQGEHLPPPSPDEELPPIEVREGEADVEDASFRHKTQVRIVSASKHVIPHFYITRGADVTALLARKAELKEKYGATVTHLIILACIQALKQNPKVNRSYDRGRIIRWRGIHVGLAIDTEGGLTVAVLRDAQGLSLKDVVERTVALVEKARGGKLSADERRHPGITVSNLGMFDVEHFQPIINPPSSITLGVSSALDAPIASHGGIRVGKLLKLTVSCDHRIIDGVIAATFLQSLKTLLEDPDTLLAADAAQPPRSR